MAYQYITQFSSPNHNARPAGTRISSITIHHWGVRGQRFQNVVNYLCRPGGNTSAHYVVEDGKVACIVAPGRRAWHSGSNTGNNTSIGIECRPEATAGDYVTVAELVRDLRAVYGDLPLKRHSDWKATGCPGVWDLARIDRLARSAASPVSNPVGGGGSVGVPNVPGAPAPIMKGFLMTLSDEKQEQLSREVSALYQAMFYGSYAGGVKYPGLLAIEAETQSRVTSTPAKVWATTVQRTDGPVSALQELADAKTLALQAQGEAAGLRAALESAAKGQALGADAIAEAARKGAEEALKGGVKVTIDVPKED